MIMKREQLKKLMLVTLSSAFVLSCTDLEISESDSIFPETSTGGFDGVNDPGSSVDQLYNDMNGQFGDQANLFALTEVSTDELLVPTRGTDWGDNGIWRTLHSHTWSPSHQYILNTWNQFNQNVFRASEVIDSRSNATAEQVANAKFIRGFSMWVVMDLFGQVPFREVDEGPEISPKVLTRAEAADFVINDLTEAIAGLPVVNANNLEGTQRASKAAAQYMLAKVLLNKHVYTGGSPDTGDMNQVVSLVDEINGAGFDLQEGFFDIFTETADSETIWWRPAAVGNRIWNTLHYNMAPEITGGGWNGFTTLAEFYDMYEGPSDTNVEGGAQEERRGGVPQSGTVFVDTNDDGIDDNVVGGVDGNDDGFIDGSNVGYGFLLGQQYDYNGSKLKTRPGGDLTFTKSLPGLVGNGENTGIRVIKYNPRHGGFTPHLIIFRYSDAHLMKAEAILRGASGDATALVNELRVLRGATPLGSVSEADLLEERGRELYEEFWRRNDMIRFGQFTRDWEFKDAAAVGDETKNLYPIPVNALLSNPNLVQNPGY